MTVSSAVAVPDYLRAMVRREPPETVYVIKGSTPVVAFGDPSTAEVATMGINPSSVEFLRGGELRTGDDRRLATLESLNADSLTALTEDQVRQVLDDCAAYFIVNPYRKWFDPLDRLLTDAVGASYYDGTACHLDLVQWATDPIWRNLPGGARQVLLLDGVPHLRKQLRQENIRLVLLNGRTVINQVTACGLVQLDSAGRLPVGAAVCELFVGNAEGVLFLGWSRNLQNFYGNSRAFAADLAAWLAGQIAGDGVDGTVDIALTAQRTGNQTPLLDGDGYIPTGTVVSSRQELVDLLTQWLDSSNAPTIGDVGSFGGTALIRIQLGAHTVVLNRDTKRQAVAAYIDDVRQRGVTASWRVIANRKGVVNKVVFGEDDRATPGWYCYLTKPLAEPVKLL